MSIIKEIYIDGILRTDFKTSNIYIDGQEVKESTKFNIFNRKVLDLNQNKDFSILYTLQVLKDEKRDQVNNDPLNGIQIKDPSKSSIDTTDPLNGIQIKEPSLVAASGNDPLNGIQIKDPKRISSSNNDPLNGIQIKEPTKNRSSITINGTATTSSTFVRIKGKLITDLSKIELYLDGKKMRDVNLTIVINITKDNLLKYIRLNKK